MCRRPCLMVHNFIYIMNDKAVKNKIVYSNFQPLTNSYMGPHFPLYQVKPKSFIAIFQPQRA